MLLILSPASVKSKKVRNEIAFALDEDKTIIPVLYQDCIVPLQLRRVQHIDFRTEYDLGVTTLLRALRVGQPTENARLKQEEVKRQVAEQKSEKAEARKRVETGRLRRRMEVAFASAKGERDENQDLTSWKQVPWGELFIVADGMGGYKGGAIAAKMTVEGLEKHLSEKKAGDFEKALQEAVQRVK